MLAADRRFDVAIIGSGFSGSLLAWVLASQGRRVIVIDAAKHPRFAIGESSTPIADLLLRALEIATDAPGIGLQQAGIHTHRGGLGCVLRDGCDGGFELVGIGFVPLLPEFAQQGVALFRCGLIKIGRGRCGDDQQTYSQ